jgi:hypothetical protein
LKLANASTLQCSNLEPSNWAWRVPSILQAAPPLAVFGLIPFLPESPRWLAYNDRTEEALRVLARINGASEQHPDVQLQFKEVVDTLRYEKGEGHSLSFAAMLKSPTNRKRLLLALSVAPLAMLTGSNIIT